MDKIKRFIAFTGVRKAELIETQRIDPENTRKMIFVKTSMSLVSPGTELAFFEGTHTTMKTGVCKYPVTMGYSSIGTVLEKGKDVTDVEPGDRVVSMSGHYDQDWTDTWERIPEGLSHEKAIFAILGSVSLHGIRTAELQIGMNVFVSGLGVIGQIALALCRTGGADILAGADFYPFRRQMAEKYGADAVFSPDEPDFIEKALAVTNKKGYDILIVANTSPASIHSALKLVAQRGKIIILGSLHGKVEMDLYTEIQRKEIRLLGSHQPACPNVSTAYYPWNKTSNRNLILQYQLKNRFDFSKLITHKGNPENAQSFYDILSKEKNQCFTAAFHWGNM